MAIISHPDSLILSAAQLWLKLGGSLLCFSTQWLGAVINNFLIANAWSVTTVWGLHFASVSGFLFFFFPQLRRFSRRWWNAQPSCLKQYIRLYQFMHTHAGKRINNPITASLWEIFPPDWGCRQTEGQSGPNRVVQRLHERNRSPIRVGPLFHVLMNLFQIWFLSQCERECDSTLLLIDIQHTLSVKSLNTMM